MMVLFAYYNPSARACAIRHVVHTLLVFSCLQSADHSLIPDLVLEQARCTRGALEASSHVCQVRMCFCVYVFLLSYFFIPTFIYIY